MTEKHKLLLEELTRLHDKYIKLDKYNREQSFYFSEIAAIANRGGYQRGRRIKEFDNIKQEYINLKSQISIIEQINIEDGKLLYNKN